jgi:putative transposase
METHLRTELVLKALDHGGVAQEAEGGDSPLRSGTQYTSLAFGRRCDALGVRPSMGSLGDAYDHAMAESFFATLECELIERRRFRTRAEATMAVFGYIEGWYNLKRRHPALGYESSASFERKYGYLPVH